MEKKMDAGYISLEEFAEKSGVSVSTVKERYKEIPGIRRTGKTYTVLSGTRYPCDKRKVKVSNSSDRRYLLLKTISEYRYISHRDLQLEEKQFRDMLEAFLRAGLICPNGLCNTYGANAYDCTEKGDAILRKKKTEAIREVTLILSEAAGTFVGAYCGS